MRTALIALILSLASPSMAAPRHHSTDASEVDAAKAALKLAKLKAKAHKAVAKAAKAVLACEQAVSDLCVETAAPDGSTDCEAPALFAVCVAVR